MLASLCVSPSLSSTPSGVELVGWASSPVHGHGRYCVMRWIPDAMRPGILRLTLWRLGPLPRYPKLLSSYGE